MTQNYRRRKTPRQHRLDQSGKRWSLYAFQRDMVLHFMNGSSIRWNRAPPAAVVVASRADQELYSDFIASMEHVIWRGLAGTGLRGECPGLLTGSECSCGEDGTHLHRTCFKCKKDIWYTEARVTDSARKFTKKQFDAIWDDPLFEFLCCSCYQTTLGDKAS